MPEEKRFLWLVYYIDKDNHPCASWYSSSFDREVKFKKSLMQYWNTNEVTGNTIYRTELKEPFEEII
jgi:hypothetical protein